MSDPAAVITMQSVKTESENREGSSIRDLLVVARLWWPLIALTCCLLVVLSLSLALASGVLPIVPFQLVVTVAVVLAVTFFIVAMFNLSHQLLKPLAALEESVSMVCQGEPDASLPLDRPGVLRNVVRDIDSLSEELTDLYEDMDSRVARQTTRLVQKTASLRILYDVAATINHSDDLDELLLRFLRVLKELVNARSATVRKMTADRKMRLVGVITLDDQPISGDDLFPLKLCMCGKALSAGDILCEHDTDQCSRLTGRTMFGEDEVTPIEVPLEFHGDVLGIYTLFVGNTGVTSREDIMELLETVGSHLGMAVAKQQSDMEARRLSIIEERTALAHELHDSLAQTLASLRFQVRMLGDTLRQSDACSAALAETARLSNGLDEAHTELRELLNSFRAPVDDCGLAESLERLAVRFQQETGIATFLQSECREISLGTSEEMQILRIVQEALANIRKHAEAHAVRILLRCRRKGELMLLVEDDGIGFEKVTSDGHPGEHIGLSIMQERAQKFGAELKIESEAGEGTRVEMLLNKNVATGTKE